MEAPPFGMGLKDVFAGTPSLKTHGTIAVPVFHEAMKRLLIGGAAAGR